jgi:hypothetical protein
MRQRRMDRLCAPEHIFEDIGAVKPRRHIVAVADAPIDEGIMVHLVERRHISITGELADFAGNGKFRHPGYELFPRLAIGDQIRHRYPLEAVPLSEIRHLRSPHDRAVVVDQLADRRDRLDAGKPAEPVDGCASPQWLLSVEPQCPFTEAE